MKTNVLLTLCILLICSSQFQVKAQQTVVGSDELLYRLRINDDINSLEGTLYSDIAGDPYIYKDFAPGKILFKTGETFDAILRYDIYADQVQVKIKNTLFAISHPEKIAMIYIGSLKFIYEQSSHSAFDNSAGEGHFFIINSDGKCRFLLRNHIRIQDPEPPKLYTEAKPAKFINTGQTFYLKLGDGKAVIIKSKNDVVSVLSDKGEEVSSLMKSKKLGVKHIQDLDAVVTYYNSL